MGYVMYQRETAFVIPQDKQQDALAAVKALAAEEEHLSWVTADEVLGTNTLGEALDAFRWEPEYEKDGNGDILGLLFSGEKAGDEAKLFAAIAPFVKEGSFLEMDGEDSTIWRWYFDGEKVEEQYPRLVYTDGLDGLDQPTLETVRMAAAVAKLALRAEQETVEDYAPDSRYTRFSQLLEATTRLEASRAEVK